MRQGPVVVVAGAASRDLAVDDPRGWRLGGGVSYSALTLARLGLRVGAVIGADADAAGAAEIGLLRSAGVEVVVVPLRHGPVFVNVEHPSGRAQEAISVSDPVPADAVPGEWRDARAWLLAPVAGELPDAWAELPPADGTVGLGWQGLLRHLAPGEPVRRIAPAPSRLVARADVVGVGQDDLEPGTNLDALAALLRPGATLLVTGGDRGGLAIEVGADGRPTRRRTWPGIPPAGVVDPTGAGDAFLAAVFAARVEPRLLGGRSAGSWDLRLGAAVGSLVCERAGLLGVPDRAAVTRRMAEVGGPG